MLCDVELLVPRTNLTPLMQKIDCEGCEYTTLPPFFDMIAAGKIKLNQLQVEMHAGVTNKNAHPAQIVNFFSSADQAGLRIFHKERNHWGCDGYTCVEYALVSEDFLREANRAAVC